MGKFVLIEDGNREDDKIKTNLRLADSVSPDDAVSYKELSSDVGLPLETVERNPNEVKRIAEQKQFSELPKATKGYFVSLENAKVSRDDHQELAEVERRTEFLKGMIDVVGATKSVGKQAARAPYNLASFALDSYAWGMGTLQAAAEGIGDFTGTEPGGMFGQSEQLALSMSKNIKDYINSNPVLNLPEELRGRLLENPEYLFSAEYMAYNTSEAAQSMIPVVAAAIYGGPAAGAALGSAMEGSSLYSELRQAGVDEKNASTASVAFGLVVGALNRIGLGRLLQKIPAGNALSRLIHRTITGGVEAGTEYLEEPFQAAFGELAKGSDSGTVWNAVMESFKNVEVIPGSFLFGAGMNTSASEAYQAQQLSEFFLENMLAVNEAVNATKTKERSPEKIREFLEAAGMDTEVFIAPEGVQTLFQSEEVAQEVFSKLGIDVEEARQAAGNGQALRTQAAKLQAFLTPEEFASIAEDIKPSPGSFTQREVNNRDAIEEITRVADIYAENTVNELDFNEELDRIREQVVTAVSNLEGFQTTDIDDYADTYVQKVSAFANRMALQGRDRVELLKRFDIGRRELKGDLEQSIGVADEYSNTVSAGQDVGGLRVREDVPNTDSIAATYDNYEVLDGIRQISMEGWFPEDTFIAKDDIDKSRVLAEEIEKSGEISPLIVGIENGKPYIVEGNHRLAALGVLGVDSFPAMVVVDKDSNEYYQQDDPLALMRQELEGELARTPIAPDQLIDGEITSKQLAQMILDGDKKALKHLKKATKLHGQKAMQDTIPNLTMSMIKDDKTAMANYKKLKSKIDKIIKGKSLIQQLFQREPVPIFYSQLKQFMEQKLPGKGSGKQLASTIESWMKKGLIKKEELKWVGLVDWLKEQDKVTKQEVLDYIEANNVQIEEVVKGQSGITKEFKDYVRRSLEQSGMHEQDDIDYWVENWDEVELENALQEIGINSTLEELANERGFDDTKFSQYQLPGGKNYKELLLTMPLVGRKKKRIIKNTGGGRPWKVFIEGESQHQSSYATYEEAKADLDKFGEDFNEKIDEYKSSHFNEPNILAHVRFNERTGANGERILFLEEIQSDWHQAGRKKGYRQAGVAEIEQRADELKLKRYRTPEEQEELAYLLGDLEDINLDVVPNAPFKQSRDWGLLIVKRMVRYAAENGFDMIAWTPGEVQANRYDLSKQVNAVEAGKNIDGLWDLAIEDKGGNLISGALHGLTALSESRLEEVVGKDLAKKIIDREGKPDNTGWHRYEGVDLKVGGEGMKEFYDKIIPNAVNHFFNKKQWGSAKVEVSTISTGEGGENITGLKEGQNPESKGLEEISRAEAIELYDSGEYILIGHKTDTGWNIRPSGNKMTTSMLDRLYPDTGGYRFFAPVPLGTHVWSLPITEQMKKKATTEGMPLFQAQQKITRGSLSITDDKYLTSVFKDANLSTILHETGHIFLEEMRSVVESGSATPEFIRDYKTILKWLKSDGDLTTEQHETFARGFEAYLMEGKAPSVELTGAFARFRRWLMEVYKSAKSLNVELTDSVRGVFDRLLSAQSDIESTAQSFGMTVKTQEELNALGVLLEDQEYMKRLIEKAKGKAEDRLVKDRNKSLKQNMTRWKEEAKREVDIDIAQKFADDLSKWDGVNRQELIDRYGAVVLDKLPKRVPPVFRKGGMSLDDAAFLGGFNSVDDMVIALEQTPTKQEAVDRIVAEKQAVHDAKYKAEDYLLNTTEYMDYLTVLSRYYEGPVAEEAAGINPNTETGKPKAKKTITRQAFKEFAKKSLDAMSVRDATRHDRFLAAMKKAQAGERKAILADDMAAAQRANEQVRLNFEMANQAIKNRKTVEALLKRGKYIKKQSKKKKPTVRQDALDQMIDLTARFNLINLSLDDVRAKVPEEDKQTLREWSGEMTDAGYPVSITGIAINHDYKKDYRDLSFKELKEVAEALDSIIAVERQERLFIDGEKATEIKDIVAELTAILDNNFETKKITKLDPNQTKEFLSGIHALHTKTEFLLRKLDGGELTGRFWNYFFKQISDAENNRNDRMKVESDNLKRIFNVYKAGELQGLFHKRTKVNSVGLYMTKNQMLSVALNIGNADNMQKLMDGYGWSVEQVDAIISNLEIEDMDFVQSFWDYIESFKKESFNLAKEVTGKRPTTVEAKPFTFKGKSYKGGYYPLDYDSKLSLTAQVHEQAKDVKSMFNKAKGTAATKHTFHFERQKTAGGQKIRLDLGVGVDHVFEMVHDLTHRKAVLNVSKLLRNKDLQNVMAEKIGINMYQQLGSWLEDVAKENFGGPATAFHRALNWARTSTTIMNMGFKATTMLTQWVGITQTIDELGVLQTLKGVNAVYGTGSDYADIGERFKFVHDKSGFMRNRLLNHDRDIRDATKKLGKSAQLKDNVTKFAFYGIGAFQYTIDIATWYGAYDKALSKYSPTMSIEEAEAKAVQEADSVVRMTQGGGGTKDLSKIQRGDEAMRLFTMFYSYFNLLYNMAVKRIDSVKKITDVPKLAAGAVWLWILPALLSELVAGRGPDDDEPVPEWLFENLAMYPFQAIVGVRDIATYLFGDYGYKITPAESAFKEVADIVPQTMKAYEEGDPEIAVKQAAETIGYLFKLPMKQVIITLGNIYDYAAGKDDLEPRDLIFTKRD